MRVLFDQGDLHALVPAGRFTIKASGAVEWHTPYSALATHAGDGDDEVFLPGFDVGNAVDAVAFGDGLVALAYADEITPRVEILDRATREIRQTIHLIEGASIEKDAPRLPGLTPMEDWSSTPILAGSGKRGLRLSPCSDGFFVTANWSGHVVHVNYAEIIVTNSLRVPRGPEDTIFATKAGTLDVVGIKSNGRHSELFVVRYDKLLGRWPKDEEPRWGMPAPAVMGDYVVTYSDEGPFRKQLALLSLPTLEEVDHALVPEWPSDVATDGERFAAISKGHLVMGNIAEAKLVIDQELTIAEVMKRAGVAPTPLAVAATNDGRGTRTWLKASIQKLVVDGQQPIVLGPRGGVYALEGTDLAPIFESFLPPGPDASARDRFFGPTRGLFDAEDGRLVISRGDELALVDRTTKQDIVAVPAEGLGLNGYVFRDGMIYVVEERKDFGEEYVVRFVAPGKDPRILGRCNRMTGVRELPFSRSREVAAWFELSEVDGQYSFHVARFRNDEVTRSPLAYMCKGFAFHDGSAFTLRDDHLFKDEARITKEHLPFAVRTLVVTDHDAFFVQPRSIGGGNTHPSQLWRVDLASGAQSIISTATVGAISSLTVVGNTLWWLEARDAAMQLFKLGEDEHVSAVCSLRL